jgi:transcriptional regulator with XRE-family HTH domain
MAEQVYTLGEQIRMRMAFLRYGQKKVADLTGISVTSLSLIVNDKRRPSPKHMKKLAEALRCTYQETLIPK